MLFLFTRLPLRVVFSETSFRCCTILVNSGHKKGRGLTTPALLLLTNCSVDGARGSVTYSWCTGS
jgi:hypothetical protein